SAAQAARTMRHLAQRNCEVVLRGPVIPEQVVELDVVELELLDGSLRQGLFREPRRILEFSGPVTVCCQEVPCRPGADKLTHGETFHGKPLVYLGWSSEGFKRRLS